ncbi:FAD-dependent oxidoreductase [Halalkalicoccus salilacus]|uniref:FAD-dependent oxidoreductase n=1 Tax=Halalkalicoccus salilacus TaxID=3117459 RepID=UPI00300EB8FF
MTLATVDGYDPHGVSGVGDRAVILGGSMAGLCASRILADGFKEVVIVERDPLPNEPVVRDGAPQTTHPHVMLEAGRVCLEELFPGFCETVLEEGGVVIDAATDMRYYDHGAFLADGPDRLPMYCASRALFEHVVRREVRALDAVRLRDECQFTTYRTDDTGTTVTGVVLRDADGGEMELSADLVVDATGRTSRTPTWLGDHGYQTPPVDEVTIDVTYSTIRIERDPDDQYSYFIPPAPPRTRGVAAIPIEDTRWEVIVQGVHGDVAPTTTAGFIEFIESMPVPEIAELVTTSSWTSEEIHHYPFPSSRWRHYERLERFPDGLVVMGDAIASFNPVYGQGMSVAALEAVVLHHALSDGSLDDIGVRFFEQSTGIVDAAWKIAVGADFEFPQTTGPKPTGTDLFNRYIARLIRQAHTDGVLTDAFYRVFRLERPPTSLLHPKIAWRVLRPSGIIG